MSDANGLALETIVSDKEAAGHYTSEVVSLFVRCLGAEADITALGLVLRVGGHLFTIEVRPGDASGGDVMPLTPDIPIIHEHVHEVQDLVQSVAPEFTHLLEDLQRSRQTWRAG